MKLNKKSKLIILSSALFLLLILIFTSLYLSNNSFTVTYYEVESDKINNSIRVVQLSDLHNSEFGEDNKELTDEIKKLEPDLIITTGDMLDGYEDEYQTVKNLLSELSKIAPLYSSNGNHEIMYDNFAAVKSGDVYSEHSTLLEKEYIEIEIKGQKLRIGGVYGYCLPEIYLQNNKAHRDVSLFVKEFQDTELFTLLMCHMPVCFIENSGLDLWEVDLVFSGHAHGGQVRLPFIGGLYAPDQGLFPGEVSGLYRSGDGEKTMVLSRGLGSSKNIPRFNNIPELTVTDILPKEVILNNE